MNKLIKNTFLIKRCKSLFEYVGNPLYNCDNVLEEGVWRDIFARFAVPRLRLGPNKHPCQYILQTPASRALSLNQDPNSVFKTQQASVKCYGNLMTFIRSTSHTSTHTQTSVCEHHLTSSVERSAKSHSAGREEHAITLVWPLFPLSSVCG